MKGKKIIFLALALIFPVIVFIFLKMFGRNEFNVPVMHQQGTVNAPPGCDFTYPSPYKVSDSLIDNLNLPEKDSLYVFYFDPSLATAMNRISVESRGGSLTIVDASSLPADIDRRIIRECVLLMEPGTSVALMDHKYRIRGYYNGSDRDEVDRLLVEIRIILKQY